MAMTQLPAESQVIFCLTDVVETGIDGFFVYSLVNYNVSPCDIDVLHHKDMKIHPDKEVEVCSSEG
jgi:hypothetical protein